MKKKDGGARQKMQLSESYDELIEGWVLFCEDPEYLFYYGSASTLLTRRERIYEAGLGKREEVKKADIMLIKAALTYQYDVHSPDLFDDPEKYPFDHWWWHLDKIQKKSYPAELLPEYLREIYFKAQKGEV
jgi:hypothetical protein